MQRTSTDRYRSHFVLLETRSLLQETISSAKRAPLTKRSALPVGLNMVTILLALLIKVLYLGTCQAFSGPPADLYCQNHSSALVCCTVVDVTASTRSTLSIHFLFCLSILLSQAAERFATHCNSGLFKWRYMKCICDRIGSTCIVRGLLIDVFEASARS